MKEGKTMKTMVIVGAGKGLGLSLAKRFGKEDIRICLLARNEKKLSSMVQELKSLGIESDYFVIDLYQKNTIDRAFAQIKEKYGTIDILEFSPTPGNTPPTSVLNLTEEIVLEQVNAIVLGAVNCVNSVIEDMLARKDGALLFTTGLSSIYPIPMMGNAGIALSALRNYVTNLTTELSDKGIFVSHLALGLFMQPNSGDINDPDTIAAYWYQIYTDKKVQESKLPEGVTPATIKFPSM